MTTETITDAFEDAAAEKLLAEAQTEMDGEGFEKPEKTRRQLAEEFLEHFQADVEKAETAVYNARRKHREAVEIRDDAEENLRRAISEENEAGLDGVLAEVAAQVNAGALDSDGLTVTMTTGGVDPITGEVDGGHVLVCYPGDSLNDSRDTEVGSHTQYAELIADYLSGGGSGSIDDYRVVAERELSDPEKEYGRREPHEVIWSGDYGTVLRVVAQETES